MKELAIEKGVAEIIETWNKLSFTVARHYLGREDRGYILGSIDEITLVNFYCLYREKSRQ